MSDIISSISTRNSEDSGRFISEFRLLLSKNKQLVELMHRKFAIDLEREKILKERDEMYEDFMVNFKTMKVEMDKYEQKFTKIIHLLRTLSDNIKNETKINRNELDEKISDIFNQL